MLVGMKRAFSKVGVQIRVRQFAPSRRFSSIFAKGVSNCWDLIIRGSCRVFTKCTVCRETSQAPVAPLKTI